MSLCLLSLETREILEGKTSSKSAELTLFLSKNIRLVFVGLTEFIEGTTQLQGR